MPERHPLALVVDDEPDICELLTMTLRRMHVRADVAMSVAEASRRLQEKQYDFCLTDMKLPDGDGLQLVEEIQQRSPDRALPVAVITAHGNMDTAIAALKLGAFDFVSKPVNLGRLRTLTQLALKLRAERKAPPADLPLILQGESPAIQDLRTQVKKVALSDAPIHVYGEAGSGKELTARAIHSLSPRSERPFVTFNCHAASPAKLEKALFGSQEVGEPCIGVIESANGGSLFFDNVTALPVETQAKLLQTLQEKCLRPLGSTQEISLDIRILSASDKLLAREVAAGDFRSDLYYRISVIELTVPPLRNRPEDIPLLARSTMREIAARSGSPTPRITQEAQTALQAYPFPGNLPQLKNILERAFALFDNTIVRTSDLQLDLLHASEASHAEASSYNKTLVHNILFPAEAACASQTGSLDTHLQAIERQAIEKALCDTAGNKTAAAEKLGISFRSLRYRLKKLEMED
ncbi:sigma-54-dependent transcriptional regulator [Microbulbifer aggregans]|uniref:sigma-54-dependent transcriptional regulator n=1 Tax=Microbulbifer aggregans TaxID=1769779 RepID=UPI001CFE6901|nr:sigma-54 dependent transcriptional regulator [Microbulbifer aggregans]